MENKETYTHKELEEALIAGIVYSNAKAGHYAFPRGNLKIYISDSVENCEQKIPKSLIDKLGIKKVE